MILPAAQSPAAITAPPQQPSPPQPRLPWAPQQAAFLRRFLGAGSPRESAEILRLTAARLAATTVGSYTNKWLRFVRFCALRGFCPLPATPASCVLYLAHLKLSGSVQPQSVQPYLSAINTAHASIGIEPGPATSIVMAEARRGWEMERGLQPELLRDERAPLPASVASSALAAVSSSAFRLLPPPLFRSLLFTAFGFLLMARASSDAAMLVGDISIDASIISVRVQREKGKQQRLERRVLRLPSARLPLIRQALERWLVLRAEAYAALPSIKDSGHFWWLPGEARSAPAAACTNFVREACRFLGVAPPPGGFFSSHSLRFGAASACNALSVPLPTIRYWGGWARTSGVVNEYIDPTVPADAAARLFFGWLLPAAPVVV